MVFSRKQSMQTFTVQRDYNVEQLDKRKKEKTEVFNIHVTNWTTVCCRLSSRRKSWSLVVFHSMYFKRLNDKALRLSLSSQHACIETNSNTNAAERWLNRYWERRAPRATQERNLRSKIWWFTEFCNSHYVSHFAAFFIVARTKISIAKSCIFNVQII